MIRIRAYFRRRRMKLAGQDPDRILTRQERRHLEQRLAKQMRRAAPTVAPSRTGFKSLDSLESNKFAHRNDD